MSPVGYLPLFIFVTVSTMTPGGATTLAAASGTHFGLRGSVPLIGGQSAGLAAMAASAAAGLAGILLALPSLQLVMRAVGSVYLLWLAWKIGTSGAPRLSTSIAKPAHFLEGVWLLWSNPKAWATTLSAAASFASLANSPLQLAILLGFAFGVAATLSLSLWCTAGFLLARLLHTEMQWRILNAALAALLTTSIPPMWF